MCVVPKEFKDSFIVKLLNAIEKETGWEDKYGEYEFAPIGAIPPRLHRPTETEITNAITKTYMMVYQVYPYQPEKRAMAKMEDKLQDAIFQKYSSSTTYAAHSIIAIAQIIALKNPVTSFYLGIASQVASKNLLGTNLWKIILDITVNMFLCNLLNHQVSASTFGEVFKTRMDKMGNDFLDFIIEKREIQVQKLNMNKSVDPILDETNPWLHYHKKIKKKKE